MRSLRSVALAALGAALAASGVQNAPAATAGDLETLRREAQAVADGVTALEYHLEDLRGQSEKLKRSIERATEELGAAELAVDEAADRLADAHDVYVTRAVESYKRDNSFELDLMLSANTLADLYAAVQLTTEIAEDDSNSVENLQAANAQAEASETSLSDQRERLVAQQLAAEEVALDTASALRSRRKRLSQLTEEITKLEDQARRAAEQQARRAAEQQASQEVAAPDVPASFLELLAPSGPSAGIPDGFASTGVSFEGVASWYGPGFEGNLTASGDIFDSSLFTAASKELPLGTWLYVEHEGKGVVVLVNDRGPYIDGRILDLSKGAAEAIGIYGLGWIRAEILVKG